MKQFEEPTIEVVTVEVEDVITASVLADCNVGAEWWIWDWGTQKW